MSQADFLKIHPIANFKVLGHDTDRFLADSSKKVNFVDLPNLDRFSRNRSGLIVMTQYFIKTHEMYMDEFSSYTLMTWKIQISEKFLDTFSRICQ